MPRIGVYRSYKKSVSRKPKSGFGKTRRRARFATKSFVRKALSATQVMRHVNAQAAAGVNIWSTATMVGLVPTISQSDTVSGREGDQVDLKSMNLNINLSRITGATVGSVDNVRVIIFKWFPDNLTLAPTAGQILEDSTSAVAYMSGYTALPIDRRKFRVLFDKRYLLSDRATDVEKAHRMIRLKFGSKRLGRVSYGQGLQTGKGHIYVMFLGANAVGTEHSVYTYSETLKFISS